MESLCFEVKVDTKPMFSPFSLNPWKCPEVPSSIPIAAHSWLFLLDLLSSQGIRMKDSYDHLFNSIFDIIQLQMSQHISETTICISF